MRWNYIVRQRHRWALDPAASLRQTQRLRHDLRSLGVNAGALKKLWGIVEVAIPNPDGEQCWEARILPWEYVLAAASAPERTDRPILVVRHLVTGRRPRRRRPKTYALIETAPGALRRDFDFAGERTFITAGLTSLRRTPDQVIEDPTEPQLRNVLRSESPDVIHLTGVDNRLARQILGRDHSGVRDGLCFSGRSGEVVEARAEQVAKTLCAGERAPLLVGFNCWDSGARMAPMTVHQGAAAAIGFQHTFDDAVAELFFANFYPTWIATGCNDLCAFWQAWQAIAGYRPRLRGSSIILWSAQSLVSGSTFDQFETWRQSQQRSFAAGGSNAEAARGLAQRPADPARDRIDDLVQVSVRPVSRLNYSLLHNGRSLFEDFTLRFLPPSANGQQPASAAPTSGTTSGPRENQPAPDDGIDRVDGLEVLVQLHVGAEAFPYRTRLSLGHRERRYDLASTDRRFAPSLPGNPTGGIRLPLTSHLIRSVSERIQTSLYVEVRWHDQILYRHTHSVWLAPVDQWTLGEEDIWWLPSFVRPRDPAVGRTLRSAQGFLRCLADSVNAGFDGYQSFNDLAPDGDAWQGVDRQVRAIWSALVLESPLNYINPPPSYAEFTQRLRSPSETVASACGTCVDLAILLASCLEWIEVYPVLILMDNHALVGYWRDLAAYDRFLDVRADSPGPDSESQESRDDQAGRRWVCGRRTYSEIKGFVDRGELVPLETVLLTRGEGFARAVEEGRIHFEKRRNHAFHSMVDIASARQGDGITPLPTMDAGSEGSGR
ncbi:hypothetical protein FYK55_09520 [Roseiconus nitratireducens]|uniref:CHAT domain-containing protein n=1 Tax=Roseiconus nitratireducens TaxID=2605748 RepID=A0A5M6DDS2_9BACT|nr:hypothetical protein [Roseiconus nitratireducens]KAA5544550.1 hypothetical protein FYK55_09520 [Roseiconus nitratireducens]